MLCTELVGIERELACLHHKVHELLRVVLNGEIELLCEVLVLNQVLRHFEYFVQELVERAVVILLKSFF
jgi:hypothetical protein